ncbi:pseudouridylate synthase, putative [Plasmodium relictum]|uniref:Pseudouridylate synthase, putative n=1 Tax=Plasmodium relictum TaxID=85471 RepID=A0A1J1H7E6_PLARL|nr:pseudouridylate synthase, putative [Plasmodium relictum]CRG99350.1 pseudouridylate synthase, putative [Plasmodium relictum]
MLYLIILILLTNIIKSFKVMKITVPDTSGLNVVDKNFQPKYFIKNKLRFVTPYIYTYKLFSKKRWIGKKISEVLASEFCAYDMNYFLESIKKGYIKVNNENISSDYIIKNNDFIEHKLLLFEKPVLCSKIIILYEDENFICVYKPSSLPTHPVGFYQYNSLLRIIQNYMAMSKNQILNNSKIDKLEDVIKINFNFKKANFQYNPETQTKSENSNSQSSNSTEKFEEKNMTLCNQQENEIYKEDNHTINLENKIKKKKQNWLNEENNINELNKPFSKDLDSNKNANDHLDYLKYIKDKQTSILNDYSSESEIKNLFSNNLNNKKEELNYEKESTLDDEMDKKIYNKINKKLNKKIKNVNNIEKVDNKNNENLYIYTLHRLDKLTSGIVLFGKNKEFSTSFSENLSNNKIKKTYIARVDGDFRKLIRKLLDENKVINNISSINLNDLMEQYCNNCKNDSSLKYNDGDSFKNDIFLYENNYKKQDFQREVNINKLIDCIKENNNDLKDCFDVSKYEEESFFDDISFQNTSNDETNKLEMYHKYFVIDFGYMYCESKKLLKYVFTKYTNSNYKDFCEYSLKPSITRFMFLSYNSQINESIILCQPITGRTHQIRAHLNSLSFPISNDSHYNRKFEEEYIKKSNYLYFDADTNDNKTYEEYNREHEINKNLTLSEKYEYFPLIPFLNKSFNWLYDENINLNSEYNEEYINKYFFKNISNVTYHSSGIFLHSFRYTWENMIDVFTLLPKWCYLFYIPKNILTFLIYGNLS